jgi:multidrug efflux pump subunit AcrA (membrane-fusion protein)
MISRKNLILSLAGGNLIVTTGAPVIFKLNGSLNDPSSATSQQVDSIASESPRSEGSSDLAIPVEGEPAILDTLVLAVSAAGQAAPWREATITARVAGQVGDVARTENAAVGSGASLASLASIDPAEYDWACARRRRGSARQKRATAR